MKPKLLIVCLIAIISANAATTVDHLTRGGWTLADGSGCYFFEPDGTGLISGPTPVPMQWTAPTDSTLIITHYDGFTEHVDKFSDFTMHWRDGRMATNSPFADKADDVARRQGKSSYDPTWHKPESARALAALLYPRSWMDVALDLNIYFFSPDTCYVTTFGQQDLDEKYLWRAVDSSRIELRQTIAPHRTESLQLNLVPDGFTAVVRGQERHFLLNAYDSPKAIAQVFDLCLLPLGCAGFFTLPASEVRAYLEHALGNSDDHPDYHLFIGGQRWSCGGIRLQPKRTVSYRCRPGDNSAVNRTFDTMDAILGYLFRRGNSTLGDHTRVFFSPAYGDTDPDNDRLQILLIKTLGSDSRDSYLKEGCVTLDIRLN